MLFHNCTVLSLDFLSLFSVFHPLFLAIDNEETGSGLLYFLAVLLYLGVSEKHQGSFLFVLEEELVLV